MKKNKTGYISPWEFVFLQSGYKMETLRKNGCSIEKIAKELSIPTQAVKAYFGSKKEEITHAIL